MVGWHHQFNGHEPGQTLGDVERPGNLACCSLWGCKESDMTRQLNNNDYIFVAKDKMKTELKCEKTQKDSLFISASL